MEELSKYLNGYKNQMKYQLEKIGKFNSCSVTLELKITPIWNGKSLEFYVLSEEEEKYYHDYGIQKLTLTFEL